MIASERACAAVALLSGVIGLGGAESRFGAWGRGASRAPAIAYRPRYAPNSCASSPSSYSTSDGDDERLVSGKRRNDINGNASLGCHRNSSPLGNLCGHGGCSEGDGSAAPRGVASRPVPRSRIDI